MTSLLKRTAVLSFSKFANQVILLVGPILLVRILSVSEYGGYREFMLYAGLITSLVAFSIPSSLAFLIPKHPEKESVWITQSALFVLASSTAAIVFIWLVGDLIRNNTSFDFVTSLQLYILFVANLDFVEFYWLGKKRTDNVLYYSLARLVSRLVVVVGAALLTGNAHGVVQALVVLEAFRLILVWIYFQRRGLFSFRLTRPTVKLQLSYVLPYGAGTAIELLNSHVGMLLISIVLGPEALAFYVIGSFVLPIVHIFRDAIGDVIFPEIVAARSIVTKDALPLWQRATIWYGVLLFPLAILFTYYADAIVTILFTEQYTAAAPVFSALALMLFVYCFEFHLPLRVQNKNAYFMIASVIALLVNVGLLYPAYLTFGLVGPAVTFVVSRVVMAVYLARCVLRVYEANAKDIVLWRDLFKVLLAAILCVPILVTGKLALENLLLRCFLFGGAYMLAYLLILRSLSVWDAFGLVHRSIGRFRK